MRLISMHFSFFRNKLKFNFRLSIPKNNICQANYVEFMNVKQMDAKD